MCIIPSDTMEVTHAEHHARTDHMFFSAKQEGFLLDGPEAARRQSKHLSPYILAASLFFPAACLLVNSTIGKTKGAAFSFFSCYTYKLRLQGNDSRQLCRKVLENNERKGELVAATGRLLPPASSLASRSCKLLLGVL